MLSRFNFSGKTTQTKLEFNIGSQEAFRKVLELERDRVHRNKHYFTLLVFEYDNRKQNQNNTNLLIQKIINRVREIDQIGWYDNTRIGIVFPYTSYVGTQKLIADISSSIGDSLDLPDFNIYTYPP